MCVNYMFSSCSKYIQIQSMFTNTLVSVTSVRPSISRSEGNTDDVTVTKGGDVTLQCAAEGVPRPAITWLKDGRPIAGQQRAVIQNEGRMLQIKDAKVSDTGRYTCIAVNVAGQADRKHDISVHGMRSLFFFCLYLLCYLVWMNSVPFNVLSFLSGCFSRSLFSCLVPPSIIGQVQLPENVSVVLKNPVALSCEASGIPLPAITWLKDGRPIKATSSVRVLSGELHPGLSN